MSGSTYPGRVFPGAYLPRWIDGQLGPAKPQYPPWRQVLFAGWAGIRGGDSLVIALALPYASLHGTPLPGRNDIIFITFAVILITLVGQGMTLAPLIRLLGIVGGREEYEEELKARATSIPAGTQALKGLASKNADEVETADELRKMAAHKLDGLTGSLEPLPAHLRLRLAMIAAEREAVIALRDRNEIGDAVLRRLHLEFDHEEILLNQRYGRQFNRRLL